MDIPVPLTVLFSVILYLPLIVHNLKQSALFYQCNFCRCYMGCVNMYGVKCMLLVNIIWWRGKIVTHTLLMTIFALFIKFSGFISMITHKTKKNKKTKSEEIRKHPCTHRQSFLYGGIQMFTILFPACHEIHASFTILCRTVEKVIIFYPQQSMCVWKYWPGDLTELLIEGADCHLSSAYRGLSWDGKTIADLVDKWYSLLL